MELRSLSATFGRLKNKKISLSSGLNVIEAANESGKSTWMTFVRVMLYGLNTRDRSPLADKHRYLPWDGSAMEGSMDLLANGRSITITRSTLRPGSPMGSCSVCFTDTATQIPELAASPGDALLGVPQEIFERSAFIRQCGVSIDHSAALEQRIAALITTGEEDTSYTDATDRLRKQLNRRRYHKNGLLPQLESEISALESTLSEITSIEESLQALEIEQKELSRSADELQHQIELCDAADNAAAFSRLKSARESLAAAETARDNAAARIASIPPRSELTGLSGMLAAVQTMDRPIHTARTRMQECAASLKQAEQQLAAHPFAPQTPEEASASFEADTPRPRLSVALCVLIALTAAAAFPLLHFLLHLPAAIAAGISLLTAGPTLLCVGLIAARRQKQWDAAFARAYAAHQRTVTDYTILYEAAREENGAFRAASESYRSLTSDQQLQLDGILSVVRSITDAETVADAQRAIEKALTLHTAAENAQQHYRQEKLRVELLEESAPQETDLPTEVPQYTRIEAEQRLSPLNARLDELRRAIHTAQGRIAALGDRVLLEAELNEKRTRLTELEKEYRAISLACKVLSDANNILQTRFSPALGEKAANIFTKLTRGKYNKVLLDRALTPSARETGALSAHSAAALSQGAADQLYLAVRLAICETVLPEDKRVPLFLDDALVTFDDDRMAAALDHLVELSRQRQILLFTCQQRELNYLRAAHPDRFHAVTLD